MEIDSPEYQGHKVFNQADDYIQLYKRLSAHVFAFLTPGTRSVVNIDSYIYSSIQGTLTSLKAVLQLGNVGDAYSLLRKFYDCIFIDVYTTLYLDDNSNIQSYIVAEIQEWLQGKRKLPETRVTSNYVRNHTRLTTINQLLFQDHTFRELRDRGNDNTHYNFYNNVLLNNSHIRNPERIKAMNQLSDDLLQLVLMHLCYIFTISPHYMVSSDYMDYFESGETPPEEGQYDVAPFLQEAFITIIEENRQDIAQEIRRHTDMSL